ncbi:hypothetical protein [Bacillus sp. XF8]|uniref:hypothetical protein n=1 Tax=Bacillus sp. XF8 TaxID=2819289 RepID=UPI001AA03C76|nr:hypothetical protein [Bacillus sp. XF8]MBO1579596.1 hypothetical protein [Bacillus sp. XF8]
MSVFIYTVLAAFACILISSLILQKRFPYKKYDVFLSIIVIASGIALMFYGAYGVDVSVGRNLWYIGVFIVIGAVTGTLISIAVRFGKRRDRYKIHVFGHILGFLGCTIQIITYFYQEYQWTFFDVEKFFIFIMLIVSILFVCIAVFFHRIFFMCVAIFPSVYAMTYLSIPWMIINNTLIIMGALLMTMEYKKKRRVSKRVEYFRGKGYL